MRESAWQKSDFLKSLEIQNKKARPRFELGISSLLVRRFNQLSHRAAVLQLLSLL